MRILLVEDHAMIRKPTAKILQKLDSDVAVIEAESISEALLKISHYRDFDLVLLDLGLPDCHGVETINIISEQLKTVPVVVVSANDDRATIEEALLAGVMGYVLKREDPDELLSAVRIVRAGNVYLPNSYLAVRDCPANSAANPMTASATALVKRLGLTKREIEVLRLLGEGLSNGQIAKRLTRTVHVAKLHVSSIFRKIDVESRVEAAIWAKDNGFT